MGLQKIANFAMLFPPVQAKCESGHRLAGAAKSSRRQQRVQYCFRMAWHGVGIARQGA